MPAAARGRALLRPASRRGSCRPSESSMSPSKRWRRAPAASRRRRRFPRRGRPSSPCTRSARAGRRADRGTGSNPKCRRSACRRPSSVPGTSSRPRSSPRPDDSGRPPWACRAEPQQERREEIRPLCGAAQFRKGDHELHGLARQILGGGGRREGGGKHAEHSAGQFQRLHVFLPKGHARRASRDGRLQRGVQFRPNAPPPGAGWREVGTASPIREIIPSHPSMNKIHAGERSTADRLGLHEPRVAAARSMPSAPRDTAVSRHAAHGADSCSARPRLRRSDSPRRDRRAVR